jgi:hypothetical protein
MMDARPLFVFGIARSGTNLLARLLSAHPAVEIALDPFMPLFKLLRDATIRTNASAELRNALPPGAPFQDGYQKPAGYGLLDVLLAADLSAPVLTDEVRGLCEAVALRAALEAPDIAAVAGGLDGTNGAALVESGLRLVRRARADGTTRWCGIKEVWVLDFLPALARAFPEAKFVAVERDPRAVIASLAALAAQDPSQHAHPISYLRHWRKSAILARRFLATPELAGRFRLVAYEKIAAQPTETAHQLADFLDLSFDPVMLQPGGAAWQANSSHGAGSAGITAGSIGRWRDTLADDAARTVELFTAPEMMLAGYQADMSVEIDDAVRDYVEQADADPGSWRSDSGNAPLELAFEERRRGLLEADASATDTDLVRRCFLFEDTYRTLRQLRRAAPATANHHRERRALP